MAALATTLTEFSSLGDSRTWTVSGHSVAKPKLVIQKRKVPTGNQTVAEVKCSVIYGTEDSDGAMLPSKVVYDVIARYPVSSGDTAIADALVVFRDVVQSTEFGTAVTSQNFLK
jgi:hypothetical protein